MLGLVALALGMAGLLGGALYVNDLIKIPVPVLEAARVNRGLYIVAFLVSGIFMLGLVPSIYYRQRVQPRLREALFHEFRLPTCPHCQRHTMPDLVRCPHCGQSMTV